MLQARGIDGVAFNSRSATTDQATMVNLSNHAPHNNLQKMIPPRETHCVLSPGVRAYLEYIRRLSDPDP